MWKLLKRKEIYTNPWISVREDIVEDHTGAEQVYGVVTLAYGSSVLPIDTEGNVYLVKQFRYGAGEDTIESPGGSIDEGDNDPLLAAQRELKEELGIQASEWVDLGFIRGLTSTIDHKEFLFLAKGFEPRESYIGNVEEGITLLKVSFEEAVQMVMESKIIHSPCVALIMKAQEYFKSKNN